MTTPHHPDALSGVPLGGVGAGCIELGRDATIRNVTINNNRTTATRIPLADGAFMAVRTSPSAARMGPSAARILQPRSSAAFREAGFTNIHTPANLFSWDGLYPASTYALATDAFPLAITWRGIGAVVPYDTEAAILPMTIFAVQAKNNSTEPAEVSVLFNWENLRGCTRDHWPERRGPLGFVVLNEREQIVAAPGRTPGEERFPLLGLTFGIGEAVTTNHEGDYALVAGTFDGIRLSYMHWNKHNPAHAETLWQSFQETGHLPDTVSSDADAHCAALCQARQIDPGETFQFVFIFTWSCPQYVIDGQDLGNGYLMKHADSVSSAAYGIEHNNYFLKAVSTLRQRFVKSSLPQWFSRMLLNNSHVFSTNTILTRDGEFSMFESPEQPRTGVLDRSFYTSLGTLLFFPAYAHSELSLFGKDAAITGNAPHTLGVETVRNPAIPEDPNTADLNPKFVLLACRNFKMTGNLARLIDLYPALRKVAQRALQDDQNGDGFPETSSNRQTFTQWRADSDNAYVGGLWIAAWQAMAYLAQRLKHTDEARQYANAAQRARAAFDRTLWNDEHAYYHFLRPNDLSGSDACTAFQLAGQTFADFLAVDDVALPTDHITRALHSMKYRLARPNGVLDYALPNPTIFPNPESVTTSHSHPNLAAAYYACAQIYHGNAEHGLEVIKAVYKNIHLDAKRPFDQPLLWDLDKNAFAGPCQDRHFGALAIWHVLFALEGFFLSVPDNTVYLRPNLPRGVDYLNAPVVTPVGLGHLTYRVARDPYRIAANISFESPIHIQHIVLAIPKGLASPAVYMTCDGDVSDARVHLKPGPESDSLHIELRHPFFIQDSVSVTVKEAVSPHQA